MGVYTSSRPDGIMMPSPRRRPEDLRGPTASCAIAQVRSLVIVEPEVAIQRDLQLGRAREEAAAELDAPQFGEDGALQSFHEAVCPRVAGARPGMRHAE